MGAILGGALGGLVIVVVAVTFLFCRRRKPGPDGGDYRVASINHDDNLTAAVNETASIFPTISSFRHPSTIIPNSQSMGETSTGSALTEVIPWHTPKPMTEPTYASVTSTSPGISSMAVDPQVMYMSPLTNIDEQAILMNNMHRNNSPTSAIPPVMEGVLEGDAGVAENAEVNGGMVLHPPPSYHVGASY